MIDKLTQDPVVDRLAELLTQVVMDHEEISDYCKRKANEHAGTKFWSSDDFEHYEDTAQYDLYWSSYARFMSVIVAAAMIKLM